MTSRLHNLANFVLNNDSFGFGTVAHALQQGGHRFDHSANTHPMFGAEIVPCIMSSVGYISM